MIVHSLILAIASSTSTPKELLHSANTLIAHQQWADAAVLLEEYVRSEEEPTPEAMYDLGVANYNIGEYESAAKAFDASMASAIDPTLQTYSAFNLGNAAYKHTLESLEGKGTEAPSDDDLILIENAKTQIKEVLESYRTAIKLDPADMDARANGELAWQMLQQLDEMQEQMEEQQQQQQQDDQQQQEQDEQSADQQKENQEQKDEGESEQDQKDQQQQDGEQSDDEQQQQQQDGEQSDDAQQQQQQDGEQSDDEQQQQQQQQQDGEQSDDEQQQQQQQQQQGNDTSEEEQNEESQKEQSTSDGELVTTDEEMNQAKGEQSHVKDEGERLSEDEANRLLQLIRDKEQQRRKILAARKAANRVPVEKDW